MDHDTFLALRPFAYHTTSARHLESLRETRQLQCAARLTARAAAEAPAGTEPEAQVTRRLKPVTLRIGLHQVHLRDQRGLEPSAIRFDAGWDLARFVAHVNGLVSFWPGTESGPSDMGRRHWERLRSAAEPLVVLRVPTQDLLQADGQPEAQVSRCHSGAAHLRQGRRVERGGATFIALEAFRAPPVDVQELMFADVAHLPASTEYATSLAGPWLAL